MKLQSHFRNGIAAALIVGTLMAPVRTYAADSKTISGWAQIIGGAAGAALSWILTEFFVEIGVNVDAAQLALEYLVYDAMKDVTDKWDPEPKETYEKAAEDNEDNSTVSTEDVQKESVEAEQWDFEVQALKNVGIEALGLKNVSELASGRDTVVSNLSRLKKDGDMLVLDMDLNQTQNETITNTQDKNYQKMSTAGIARAELGLETTYQASVDAGGEAANITDDTSGDDNVTMSAAAAETSNVGFTELPSSVTSTGMAMRVQILMNLELAQRVNLANALQGNILTIEAARALKRAPRALRGVSSDDSED